jgi:hypothetical protein
MNRPPIEHTGRVIALALAFFGTLAILGIASGVFERLPRETLLALFAFAVFFSAGTYVLDREVRAFVNRALRFRRAAAKSPGGKPAAT